MVDVAQLVEPLIVVQVVVGSSPIVHPIFYKAISMYEFGDFLMKNKKEEFLQNKFAYLESGIDFRSTDLNLIKYKGPASELVKDHKDRGMLKASKNYIEKHIENYAIFLASSDIISVCESIYETKLFPLKFMHTISDNKTGALPWHRDSYTHRGIQRGAKPAPIKLAIYLTNTNKLSGGSTGFLPKKYQKTFNNFYIDWLYMILYSSKAFFPEFNEGDAGLWDGTIPHCRTKSKGKVREAVIFSLSRSPEIAESYSGNSNSLLSHYIRAI